MANTGFFSNGERSFELYKCTKTVKEGRGMNKAQIGSKHQKLIISSYFFVSMRKNIPEGCQQQDKEYSGLIVIFVNIKKKIYGGKKLNLRVNINLHFIYKPLYQNSANIIRQRSRSSKPDLHSNN